MPGSPTTGYDPKVSDYAGDGYGKQGKIPSHQKPSVPKGGGGGKKGY